MPMNEEQQREYWRDKQRESRARRKRKQEASKVPPIILRSTTRPFVPAHPAAINANVSCRASMEEIAALGPERCAAFMNGVASVISVLYPRTPVGGQHIR
jgi:hypothetical protein